jgi:hypothetical protein
MKSHLIRFFTIELGHDQMIVMFKLLLKQLPPYRKALTYDLLYLLARVASFSSVNLMSPDNLATIFGGMGDIISNKMNPSDRAFCCRFMIENFDAIFDGVMDLAPRPDDPSLNTVREGIKIYLVDGTFKALICVGSETAKDIAGKTAQKLQQQLNIDCSNFKLWELRDTFVRPMADSEKCLAIQKSQSALIFTNQLNPDEKRIVATGEAKMVRQTSSLNSGTLRSEKSDKDKKPREKRSGTAREGKSGTGRQSSKSKIDKLETSASSDSESVSLSSTVFSAWAFFTIPPGSNRASEWDTDRANEAEVHVSGGDTDRIVKLIANGKELVGASVNAVDDSSRYFVIVLAAGERIGVGFETREDAARFRHIAGSLFLNASPVIPHTAGADAPVSSPPSDGGFSASATAAGAAYWTGPVDFTIPIEDGFYDCGMQLAGEVQPSFEELLKQPANLNTREVILVNAQCDPRLARLTQVGLDLVRGVNDLSSKMRILALYVSNVMGGTDIASGLCALEEQQDARTTLAYLSATSLAHLRKRSNTNVVKLGHVTHGVARHRALLFKYLCDRLQPAVPVSLLRSDANKYEGDLTWNYVAGFKPHHFVYVDLMHDPGRTYHASSTEVAQITAALHGSLNSLSNSSAALAALSLGGMDAPKVEAASDPVKEQVFSELPKLPADSPLHLFAQIGAGPDSLVFRGSLGSAFAVAVKQTPKSKGTSFLEYAAYKMKFEHKNILPYFGQQVTENNYRVAAALSGKGSLKDHVRERKTWGGEFPEEQVWAYAAAVCDGLEYLHASQYFHGLLRCSNVIVDGSIEPFSLVRLTDMIISPAHLPIFQNKKRLRWWAPEAVRAAATGDYSFDYRASDMWSVGMFLVELVSLRAPYAGLPEDEVRAAIAEGRFPPNVPPTSPFLPIIQQCLQVDASKRPTAKDLAATCRSKLSS